jgi:hypothetical protein
MEYHMSLHRFMLAPSALPAFVLMAFAAGSSIATAKAKDPPRQLPEVIIRDICAAYDGKPAFDSKDETTTINCNWIRDLSIIPQATPIEVYRDILDHAVMLADLRNAKLPSDIDCGNFDVQRVAANLSVVCRSDLGEKVPLVFLADESGKIQRMETVIDYKSVYREALRRSIKRGSISRFYEPYVDLNTDLILAKLRFTASPLDSVRLENGRISIMMGAPARPSQPAKH